MEDDLSTGISLEHPAGLAPLRTEDIKTASHLLADSPEQAKTRTVEHRTATESPTASALQPAVMSEISTLLNAFRVLLLRHFMRYEAADARALSDVRSVVPG